MKGSGGRPSNPQPVARQISACGEAKIAKLIAHILDESRNDPIKLSRVSETVAEVITMLTLPWRVVHSHLAIADRSSNLS